MKLDRRAGAYEASRRGTELVSPVAGSAPGNSHEGEGDGPPPLSHGRGTAAQIGRRGLPQIDVTGEQATVCPAGHPSIEEYELKDAERDNGTRPRAVQTVLGVHSSKEQPHRVEPAPRPSV